MGDVSLDGALARDRTELRPLRTLLDQLPALVAYWDRDCRNVVANQAYVEYFGLDPEQIRGMHASAVLGADLYAKNLPFITGVLAGQEQLFDRTLIDQCGDTRHTQASYIPDVAEGVVNGFSVLVTDVTPRVEAQRAMDEAQAIARLGSWELDVVTGGVTWSRNLYEIVGMDPHDDSPLSLPVRVVHIHAEDRDLAVAKVEEAIETGKSYVHHYRIVTVDGRAREVVGRTQPVLGHDGHVTRVHGTLQDVTEANAAARRLSEVNAELRRANELNADVIAMLGHDIRSPLTAVLAHLEDLEEDWTNLDDEERRYRLSRVRAASERLGTIVERILALAAIDAGSIAVFHEELDLAGAIDESARESGLPGLPVVEIDPSAPQSVSFDRVHLQQILANLLTNAFRYGAEPVSVAVAGDLDRVEIAVADAGSGVPADELSSLFTRFARTGPRQLTAGGSGFGLYMAAQLAEANGATLSYRSADGDRPHAFVLTLPAGVDAAATRQV